ncbi:MAG TPA: hypothetical protein EYP25_11330 [Anaerolineae bacterium]|nr:hypothetical protein [Anaerolineae bacterium]
MKHNRVLILLTALLLVFALAACGGGEKESTSAPARDTAGVTSTPAQEAAATMPPTPTPEPPTPTPEPTNTPTPEPTPEPIEELSGSFQEIEDVVDSYRSKSEVHYIISGIPDSEDINVTMEYVTEWTKADNPAGFNMAMRMTMSGLDNMEGDEVQIVMIDDTAYVKFDNKWVSMARDEMDAPSALEVEDVLQGLVNPQRVGMEKVNGIETIHYSFSDITNYDFLLQGFLQENLKDEYISMRPKQAKSQGDIWVAKDGGYLVKMDVRTYAELEFIVDGEELSPAILDFRMYNEVTKVNSDIRIEPPEGAPKPGEVDVPGFDPGTFPIPEETRIEGSVAGMTSLVSQLGADEVSKFYDETLAALGWTKQEGFMPTWTKDGYSFNILINPNEDGTTSIIIMTNPNP